MGGQPALQAKKPVRDSLFAQLAETATLAAGFALSGFLLISMTFDTGRIAAFWIGNAFVIGLLLRRSLAVQVPMILACFAANVALNLFFGDPVLQALGLSIANLTEITVSIFALQRLFGGAERFEGLDQLGIVAVIALTVPAVSGVIATIAVSPYTFTDPITIWGQWLMAHGLPLAVFTPLMLIARDPQARPSKLDRAFALQWGSVFLSLAAVIPVIFLQHTFPFLFLAAPVVIFAAFRTGRLGTAITVAILACAASLATFHGYGPIPLVRGGAREQIIVLQTFLASCVAIGLPMATVLSNRAAIRAELKDSRDFVASIIDGIADIVFKVDGDWRWTFLNRRWAEDFRVPAGSGLGAKAFSRIIEEDQPIVLAWKNEIEAGAHPGRIVVRAPGEGQRIRHVSIGIEPQFDAEGRFAGGVGTISDVSDSVAQSHALLKSEDRFRRLAQASPVGIFQADATGQIVYVNEQWKRLSGLDNGQWEGGLWSAALHPEDAVKVRTKWSGVTVLLNGTEDEIRWVLPDGSIAWAHVVFRPETGPDGSVSGYVGVVSDITARKEAQIELAKREEQLALLANNATDAVVRLTLGGTCIYASPSAREVFGIDPELLMGQMLMTGFHEEDRDGVEQAFRQLASGDTGRVRIAFRSQSLVQPATYNWLEANCGLVRDTQTGDPEEIIASLRNVNETKRLEAELVAAKDAAESAVEAKSAFLANMSHEIRTPMNGVIGFTELALAGPLADDQRQNLEMIAESGRAMLRLLNDLLDLAKIDSGQLAISAEPTNIRHKLRSALRLMEPVAAQKSLPLELDVADEVPEWVLSDPMRLRQIVLNLIGNALKFTDEGSVRVNVGMVGDNSLEIAVSDTGIGIASDRIAHVFHKFTQADETIARRFGGTGLGLPISAELAGLLGGSLHARSTPGEGSTFTLTLPCVPAEAPASIDERDTPPGGDSPFGGARVLVAEDNPINQRLTLAMLEKAGCVADLAEDGEFAVRLIEQASAEGRTYDLVLMDLQMPNLDGLAAARRLRAAGFDASMLPIIALTANAFADDIAACRDAGMQDHLAKPLRMRDLGRILQKWAATSEPAPDEDYERETDPKLVQMFASRKRTALEAIEAGLRNGALEGETLAEIAALLHQIAGVAAFFGEAELGKATAVAENRLRSASKTATKEILLALQRRLLA